MYISNFHGLFLSRIKFFFPVYIFLFLVCVVKNFYLKFVLILTFSLIFSLFKKNVFQPFVTLFSKPNISSIHSLLFVYLVFHQMVASVEICLSWNFNSIFLYNVYFSPVGSFQWTFFPLYFYIFIIYVYPGVYVLRR